MNDKVYIRICLASAYPSLQKLEQAISELANNLTLVTRRSYILNFEDISRCLQAFQKETNIILESASRAIPEIAEICELLRKEAYVQKELLRSEAVRKFKGKMKQISRGMIIREKFRNETWVVKENHFPAGFRSVPRRIADHHCTGRNYRSRHFKKQN